MKIIVMKVMMDMIMKMIVKMIMMMMAISSAVTNLPKCGLTQNATVSSVDCNVRPKIEIIRLEY